MATLGLPTSSMVSGSTYVMPNPGQRVILSGNRATVSQVQRPQGSGVSIRWGLVIGFIKSHKVFLHFLYFHASNGMLKLNCMSILKITMAITACSSGTCIVFLYFNFYDKLPSENHHFHFIGRGTAKVSIGHGPTARETCPCARSCPSAAGHKNPSVISSCHPHQSFHKHHQLFICCS